MRPAMLGALLISYRIESEIYLLFNNGERELISYRIERECVLIRSLKRGFKLISYRIES